MYVPPTATASEKDAAADDDLFGDEGADEVERAGGVELPAQDVENASSGFSSREDALFWEYTGEGFVPVDPSTPPSQTGVHAGRHADQESEGCAWL